MNSEEVVAELKALGRDSIKKVLMNHGMVEPLFGVKIEDMKKIQRCIKMDYQLALDLYDTGIYDAMYFAGLIANDMQMTRSDLNHWAEKANCYSLSESTVPWVAAEGSHGYELALEWIESKKENVASSGWATLSCLVSLKKDEDLNISELKKLLQRVENTIHDQPNRVRSVMNSFIIAVGSYVAPLTQDAIQTAEKVGKVSVNVGATACKVAYAPEYIQKAIDRGNVGKKRKTVKC